MPKSKRTTAISLTKTGKKVGEFKVQLVEDIRSCIEEFPYVYLFKVNNMRNQHFQEIRMELKESRFFMGKNKVMAIALGRTEESAYHENMHLLSQQLEGNNVGLLFTAKPPKKAKSFFKGKKQIEYARTGGIATETVKLSEGPLMLGDEPFPHSMETYIRSLGLPTLLKNGIVMLQRDHVICNEGDQLSSNQANILKSLCIPMAEFEVDLISYYHKGKYYETV